jgi:hypothetical protein
LTEVLIGGLARTGALVSNIDNLFVRLPVVLLRSPLWSVLKPDAHSVWEQLAGFTFRISNRDGGDEELGADYDSGELVATVGQDKVALFSGIGRTATNKAVATLLRYGCIGWKQDREHGGRHLKYGIGWHEGGERFQGETWYATAAAKLYRRVAPNMRGATPPEIAEEVSFWMRELIIERVRAANRCCVLGGQQRPAGRAPVVLGEDAEERVLKGERRERTSKKAPAPPSPREDSRSSGEEGESGSRRSELAGLSRNPARVRQDSAPAVAQLEATFAELTSEAFPGVPFGRWSVRERGQAAQLLASNSTDHVYAGMTYMVQNWSAVAERFRLNGLPSVRLLASSYGRSFIAEGVTGRIFGADRRRAEKQGRFKGEYDPAAARASPSVGWGDEGSADS